MISCVYEIKNKINDKRYIGHTSNFNYRKNTHLHLLRTNKHTNKRVLCIETNIEYISIAEAARSMNFTPQSISKVCLKRIKKTGGYSFVYVN